MVKWIREWTTHPEVGSSSPSSGKYKKKVLSILCKVYHRGSGHKGVQGGGPPAI